MNTRKFLCIAVFIIVMSGVKACAWEYVGYVEAIQRVQIRPEISAKIVKTHFREGTFIKKGATLFTLNTALLQAEVSLKKAELSHAKAELDGAVKYLARLKATDKRGVPASDVEAADSEVNKAKAVVAEANAALKAAQIQLGYTRITAPFSGRVGKALFHTGSYVSPENVLCEIVQTNPVRIVFAMPDRDYLSMKASQKNAKYELILPDGALFSGDVSKDFEDNVMNPESGTINIWLQVDNANDYLLPGAMVRVRVTEEG